MPTINSDEVDWLCYIGAIKIASERLRMGRTKQESLHMGWQVHRLAMNVMKTEVWKKYPSLKKMVWNSLKNTVGFMDELMNYNDISGPDRAEWKLDYSTYMDARNKAEGRCYYAFRCRSKVEEKAGDTKRKFETTITTEIVVKKQKVEDSAEDMVDMVEMEDIDLPETVETLDEAREEVDADEEEEVDGDATNEEKAASEEGEMDIRKMFESDSDDEDEETANGTGATLEGGEDDEDGNEESERPELGGLCVVDKREGIFIVQHGCHTEESLYNQMTRLGTVVNMTNRDGSEFKDPNNIPPVVAVEFERVNDDQRDKKENRQKWKIFSNYYENVTLKEGRHRWDTCNEDNLLGMIKNNDQIMVLMKNTVEEFQYYSKRIITYYRGQKIFPCEAGMICMRNVREFNESHVPGRVERSQSVHNKKCIELKEIDIIQVK